METILVLTWQYLKCHLFERKFTMFDWKLPVFLPIIPGCYTEPAPGELPCQVSVHNQPRLPTVAFEPLESTLEAVGQAMRI